DFFFFFFFSSRRRHTRSKRDWSSDVCSSDLVARFSDARQKNQRLPRLSSPSRRRSTFHCRALRVFAGCNGARRSPRTAPTPPARSEERRVGKEWRSRWSTYH